MAPRGSTRGQSTQPGRALRNSAGLSAKPSRGGIQKRRGGGPTRTDVDGDLDMDGGRRAGSHPPSDSSQAPRGPRAPRGTTTRGPSRAAQAVARHINGDSGSLRSRVTAAAEGRRTRATTNLVWLKVRGLKESKAANNEGGGVKELLGFLERKASAFTNNTRQVMVKKSRVDRDLVYVASSKEDADEIIKLNKFTFAGAALDITPADDPTSDAPAQTSAETQDLRTKLQGVLSARYDGAAKLLRLNTLAQDASLVEMGSFANRERAEKTFKALMKICDDLFKTAKEKQDAIQSISLAENNIDDVVQVDSVANAFPDLKHLDLSGNQLGDMAGLARWKNKFRRLETLHIARNPLVVTDPNYSAALMDMFPSLQALDGAQIRTAEQAAEAVAARAASRLPKPLPQHGPDFRDTNGIGEAFLLEFFATFDLDRQGLLAKFYDDATTFSLSIDTNSVRDANAPPPMPWASWIKFSRNLKKITHDNARHQRLFRGRQLILDLWKNLPVTKHPDIKTETNKYVMDCHSLLGLADPNNQTQQGVAGMVITVHGEFDEMDKDGKTGKRSFSRTLILGPGLAGGSPIRVVSDLLCLRAANALPDIFAQATQMPQTTNTPAPQQQPQQPTREELLIAELCKVTGMTPEYSRMCLEQGAWDPQQAMKLYNETKANLPAEAWAVAPAA